MNAWKRLTREESKEVTRMRTHRSSREVFTRKGFDDASVEEISETTGYSPFSCSSAVPAAEVVRLVYSWDKAFQPKHTLCLQCDAGGGCRPLLIAVRRGNAWPTDGSACCTKSPVTNALRRRISEAETIKRRKSRVPT